jgi:hypothetical protein
MIDHLLQLEGRRVVATVDGQRLRGRLISSRDGFLTLQQDRGPRISINRFEVSTICEETRPVSRRPKVSRTFWKGGVPPPLFRLNRYEKIHTNSKIATSLYKQTHFPGHNLYLIHVDAEV